MPGISEIDPSLEDVRTAHIAEVVCQLICRQCPGIKTEIACGQRDASIEGERWVLRKIGIAVGRSEEHTSELQSRQYLVCRLLLEKKKIKQLQRKLSQLTKTAF